MLPQTGRRLDMSNTSYNIYHPANTCEKLPLPLPLRYFEAEPGCYPERPSDEKRDADGRLHSENDFAICFADGAYEYWRHGRANRDNGLPAIYVSKSNAVELLLESASREEELDCVRLLPGAEIRCVDGLIHNDSGPAIVHHVDEHTYSYEYWCRGRRHCDDGAAIRTSSFELWCYHGLLHRADGPAFKSKKGKDSELTCYWYGRKLAFDESLDDDFPADEPPPLLVLHALANSESCPYFDDEKVVNMIARTFKLMPELNFLAEGVGVFDWEMFKGRVRIFLDEPAKYQWPNSDTLALPEGFGDDS